MTTVIREAGAGTAALGGVGAVFTPSSQRPARPGAPVASLAAIFANQADRAFLWTPVAFGLGAAAYLAAPSEPSWLLLAGLAALATAGSMGWALTGRSGFAQLLLMFLACGAVGAAAGATRTRLVQAPVVADIAGPRWIEGWVVDVDSPGTVGPRLLVAPSWIGGASGALPALVRIGVAPEDVRAPGSPIRVQALLNPPPAPAAPGAYDFGRDAFFRRIGGVGFALKPPTSIDLQPPAMSVRLSMTINSARWALAARMINRMGPDTGGFAVAMVTGHEAWVTREDVDAMRDSGLAHVLSISGLHMTIVGGFVFFAVRVAGAAWPWLAVRVSTKKLAAVAGLVAVTAYLALSGAPPPAVRAAVTASVAFAAILLERRAVTLRSLAFAALIVLALQPEAVLQPGFQMSFAATTALVAFAEAADRPIREINTPWQIALVQRGAAWVGLTLLVSTVAGAATAPFAIQHFNRVASYGLLANLLTAPLTSFVLMPSLAVGAAGEPGGWGGPFLALAGWAVDVLQAVARWTAGLPNAVVLVPSAPAIALAISFLGILYVCLWRGASRWLGLPAACAVILWPRPEPPTIWIAEDGANLAVVSTDRARLAIPDTRLFAAELWSRRRGLTLAPGDGFSCSRKACRSVAAANPVVALWRLKKPPKAAEALELCRNADVVVWRSYAPVPRPCRAAYVLKLEDLRAGGAAELYQIRPGRWRSVWVQDVRGRRPWTQ